MDPAVKQKRIDTKTRSYGDLRFNDQSFGEELANALSHGVAALLSVIGLIAMLVNAVKNHKGVLDIVAVSIFGAGFTALYFTSFLYHTTRNLKVKKVLQILDHCMIYVMITASYAPVCLCMIKGAWGIGIFAVNLVCMILGITVNLIDMHKFYKLSQALYIIMGWMIVVAAYPAIRSIPLKGLILIAVGGILYTTSVIFYKMKDTPYMHFVFHLFVLAGSVPHFIYVLLYCCNMLY